MSEIKVTDAEALEWASQLSDSEKIELKRRALERRAIELAQPDKEPNLGGMSDAEFLKWRMQTNGF